MPNFFDNPTDKGFVKSFDGLQIYWELHGPAPSPKNHALLYCYGLGCSKYQWRSVARLFPDRPNIYWDYRGHHKSEYVVNTEKLNLSIMARDADSVLQAAGAKTAHIFGHSMGCNVALELAFANPKRVESLILVAGSAENPFGSMLGVNFFDKIMPQLLSTFPKNEKNFYLFWNWLIKQRTFLKTVVSISGFNRKAVESEDIDIYLDSIATVHPRVFFELLFDLSQGKTIGLLPRIQCPSLVVSGANDQVTPKNSQINLAKGLVNSELFSVPLGSHNVQLEFADYLVRRIKEFWADFCSQSPAKPVIRKTREKKS